MFTLQRPLFEDARVLATEINAAQNEFRQKQTLIVLYQKLKAFWQAHHRAPWTPKVRRDMIAIITDTQDEYDMLMQYDPI